MWFTRTPKTMTRSLTVLTAAVAIAAAAAAEEARDERLCQLVVDALVSEEQLITYLDANGANAKMINAVMASSFAKASLVAAADCYELYEAAQEAAKQGE